MLLRRWPRQAVVGAVRWQGGSLPATPGSQSAASPHASLPTMPKLDVSALSPPWTGLPRGAEFAAERSGEVDLDWLAKSPELAGRLRQLAHVPTTSSFWAATSDNSLETIAANVTYSEILHLIAEHDWRHLIANALTAADAPLPHIVYEDLLKTLAFSSKQHEVTKQFQLDGATQRALLCRCAFHVLQDPAYFEKVEALFRQMEQHQIAAAEAYSAFVMCCLAAGRVKQAVDFMDVMDQNRMQFDPVVFALTMHPGVSINDVLQQEFAGKAKGMLLQQRVASGLQAQSGAAATAVHAAFVLYSLSHRHARKWEIIREAVSRGIVLNERTVRLLFDAWEREKGRYCGPLTSKALAKVFAHAGRVDRVAAVLMAMRQHEQNREVPELMRTAFDADETSELLEMCLVADPVTTRKHEAVLRRLILNDASPLDAPVARSVRGDSLDDDELRLPLGPRVERGDGAHDDAAEVAPPSHSHGQAPQVRMVMKDEAGTNDEDDEQSVAAGALESDSSKQGMATEVAVATGGVPVSRRKPKQRSKKGKRKNKARRDQGAQARLPTGNEGFEQLQSANDASPTVDALRAPTDRVRMRLPRQEEGDLHHQISDAERDSSGTLFEDHHNAVALREAATARAVAAEELRTMRGRLTTAWMNPEAHYRR